MKTLVTGAAGRIGANLVKALLDRGEEVRAFILPDDPKATKLAGLDVEIVRGDLRDADVIDRAMEGTRRVAHLGYIMGRPEGMSKATEFDINMTGTFNVLEAASRRANQVERFLFASTNATYDAFHPRAVPMDESHPQEPRSFYGLEKLLGERMVEGYRRQFGLQTTIVRFGTVPGPDEVLGHLGVAYVAGILRSQATDPTSALYAPGVQKPWRPVEEAIQEGYPLVIPRDLDGKSWMQDLVDVRDTVRGIVLALESEAAVGQAFNTTGFGVTWEEAVPHLARKTGQSYKEIRMPNMWYWRCDNTKAERLLGYVPQITITQMIDDALAFKAGEDIGVFPA